MQSPLELITFVCCIEQGRLEKQTILMLTTLRANSVQFANCRVIAVVGRFGPSLSRVTIETLKTLNIELVIASRENNFSWFNYSNKIVAVNVVQRMAITPFAVWLDSDLLFLGAPNRLLLTEEEDIVASLDYLPPAIVEDDLTHTPYWKKLCDLLNVDFKGIPLVFNYINQKNQRAYLSSGVFVWRRSTNFAFAYQNAFESLLKSRLAQFNGTFFTADQVILSPVILLQKLRWRNLDYIDHHVTIPGQIDGPGASPSMQNSNVLHYSQSLNQPYRAKFMRRLRDECPTITSHIEANEKLFLPTSKVNKFIAFGLRFYRGLRWRLFARKLKKASKG